MQFHDGNKRHRTPGNHAIHREALELQNQSQGCAFTQTWGMTSSTTLTKRLELRLRVRLGVRLRVRLDFFRGATCFFGGATWVFPKTLSRITLPGLQTALGRKILAGPPEKLDSNPSTHWPHRWPDSLSCAELTARRSRWPDLVTQDAIIDQVQAMNKMHSISSGIVHCTSFLTLAHTAEGGVSQPAMNRRPY